MCMSGGFILSGPEVGFRLMEELLRRGAYFTNMFHVTWIERLKSNT